jgi:hypothetical protein
VAAAAALARRDINAFIGAGFPRRRPSLVYSNREQLRRMGLLEQAVVRSLDYAFDSFHDLPIDRRLEMIEMCDRGRLRAAGKPLPGEGPFKVFRGVCGVGPEPRREHGLCWTLDFLIACEWAVGEFFDDYRRPEDPRVLVAYVSDPEILWYGGGIEWEVMARPAEYAVIELGAADLNRIVSACGDATRQVDFA